MGKVREAIKEDRAQMSAGGRGDLTSIKGALLCPSRVEDTYFCLGVTQWAGWFLSGGGCRDQMRLPRGSCPRNCGPDAAGLEAASPASAGSHDWYKRNQRCRALG